MIEQLCKIKLQKNDLTVLNKTVRKEVEKWKTRILRFCT